MHCLVLKSFHLLKQKCRSCLLHWLLCRSLIGAQAPLLPPPILWLFWAPGKSPIKKRKVLGESREKSGKMLENPTKMMDFPESRVWWLDGKFHTADIMSSQNTGFKKKNSSLAASNVRKHRLGVLLHPRNQSRMIRMGTGMFPCRLGFSLTPWRHPFLGASSQASSCGREWRVIKTVPCTGHPSVCFMDFTQENWYGPLSASMFWW